MTNYVSGFHPHLPQLQACGWLLPKAVEINLLTIKLITKRKGGKFKIKSFQAKHFLTHSRTICILCQKTNSKFDRVFSGQNYQKRESFLRNHTIFSLDNESALTQVFLRKELHEQIFLISSLNNVSVLTRVFRLIMLSCFNNAITDGGVAPPTLLLTIVMMSSNLKSLRISRNSKDSREGQRQDRGECAVGLRACGAQVVLRASGAQVGLRASGAQADTD